MLDQHCNHRSPTRFTACRINIADHSLLAFVHAEAESADSPLLHRHKSGQNPLIEILQQQLRGPVIIPAQPLLPRLCFLLQQPAQLLPGEVPQVQHIELLRRCHLYNPLSPNSVRAGETTPASHTRSIAVSPTKIIPLRTSFQIR